VRKKFGIVIVNMIVRARNVRHKIGIGKILKPREMIGVVNRAKMVNLNKN
jgi:hypothetical protein